MTPEKRRRLANLARHDVVSLGQLRASGFSTEAVRHLLRSGHLFRRYRGVFAVGREQLGIEGEWLAAVLACGPGALLSHVSALMLWGLADRGPGRPHVTVTSTAGRSGPRGIDLHRSPSAAIGARQRNLIPVTGLPRTLIDSAARLEPRALKSVIRRAEQLHYLDLVELRKAVEHPRTAPGPARLRASLDEFVPGSELTESELELRCLELCATARLPLPVPQVWFGRHRADFVWHELRLIVETDGRRWHSGHVASSNDHAKDRALKAAGYEVLRFTWADVVNRPQMVARELRAAMARRRRELGLSSR